MKNGTKERETFTAFLVNKAREIGLPAMVSGYDQGSPDVIDACGGLTAQQADACLRDAKRLLRAESPSAATVNHRHEVAALLAEIERLREYERMHGVRSNEIGKLRQENACLRRALAAGAVALERQLDAHKRTWLAARAEVEGEGVSACLFEAEPETIAARAAIKKARGGT